MDEPESQRFQHSTLKKPYSMRKILFVALIGIPLFSGCQKKSPDSAAQQGATALTESSDSDKNFKQGVDLLQKGDYDNALKSLRLAAEKGHQFAQFKLGSFYEEGLSGKVDLVEAAKWYQMAANQGHTIAQVKIGAMYRYGLGMKSDYEQAKKWYAMAAKNGNQEATTALSEIEAESSSGSMTFLNSFVGKYPHEVNLLEHPILSKRLATLIGDRFEFMKKTWAVAGPMQLSNGKFIASACMAHNCASTNFIIIYDFASNILYAGIREDDVVTAYSENGASCAELQAWASNRN